MRHDLIAATLLCLLPLVPAAGFAQQPTIVPAPDLRGNPSDDTAIWHVYGLRPGDLLNMRSAPSPTARVILQLEEGTPVDNLSCRETNGGFWCRVATIGYPRVSGWVNGRYIDENWGPDEPAPSREEKSASRRYDDTGRLRCELAGEFAVSQCAYGIVRKGPFAELDITFPNGFVRSLDYRAGRFRAKDGTETRSHKQGGDAIVTVGGMETFHVPDDVVMGD